jgi:hypothetical protein
MPEIMDNLKYPKGEIKFYHCEIRFVSILMFFAVFPNICGLPLTWFDGVCIGLFFPYVYWCYLKMKELKDAYLL